MTAQTTSIAKIAAALAVVGLVASSVVAFAPAAKAETTTSTSVMFTRDLTIGSTGSDVTSLQNWLIKGGYAIPAGATGYFGAQTAAALAKYQAAVGISPAAGYFGPITRAKVNGSGPTVPGTPSTDDNDDLSSGEANLTDYDLKKEESAGAEGATEVEIATAEFDVEDGDARVERLEVEFQPTNGSLETNPWNYFDNVSIWADGEKLADMDVDSRSDWDDNNDDTDHTGSGDYYTLTFTGLDYVVDEGDTAKITIAADIAGNIDSADLAQNFHVTVADDGIRAVDGEGIQQYTGVDTDYISFGFDAEENGDLKIKSNSDDPDASILVADDEDESDEYTVFVFDIKNDDDADSLITDLTIDVNETGSGSTTDEIISEATLVVDGDEYDGDIASSVDGDISFDDLDIEIAGDDEMTFELKVRLVEDAPTTVTALTFGVTNSDVEAEGVDSGDDADVSGSATSASHTIALTGITVEPVSTSQSVSTPGDQSSSTVATYTIKFDVTALEEDAFIDDIATSAATTNGVGFALLGESYSGTVSTVLTSTATLDSGTRFRVDEGDTETFTLTVTLNPSTAGTFGVRLDEVNFADTNTAGNTVFTVDSSNEDFRTDLIYVAN